MNYKKGYLLLLLCGLLLASGVQADDYDDDYYDNDDYDDDYGGPEGRPFPPKDRPLPPEDRPFSPQDQPFPPRDRFYPDKDKAQIDDSSNYPIPFDLSYLTKESNPYFNAICTAKDRCVTGCDSTYKDGCICYNDGTCSQQYVNRCHQCTDPNVYAVFEGSSCPRPPYPEICAKMSQDQEDKLSSKRRRSHRGGSSKRKGSGLKVICSGEKQKSCVCDMQGECILRMLDICDVCQSKHYSAIFLNSTCPDTSLQATCDSASVIPAPTTCNFPQAYNCQDDDRTSMTCNLQSSSLACVCYANGTCASQPSSACACQNPNIISVFAGSACPTNCTTNVTNTSEEGESESEEVEAKTENEESEKSEGKSSKEEAESTAVANQSSTMSNLSDQFTPKNPDRFVQCELPYAYSCKDVDRGATSCSNAVVDSCICNNAGICISVKTNKCKACSSSDVVSVLENDSCSSRCKKFDAQNVAPATSIPKNNTQDVSPIIPPNQTAARF